MIGCGIDIGSRTTKVVLYDSDKAKIIGALVADSELDRSNNVRNMFYRALRAARFDRGNVDRVITTGYGRESIPFADETVTEITCHAVGVCRLLPDTRSIIEIGGQDSKIVRLDAQGKVSDFAMNDRCAAGTGRFLESVARLLDVEIGRLGGLARRAKKAATISSMCVVFAESEVIGLLARKVPRAEIVAGIQRSLATRVISLTGGKLTPPVVFTGGVAMISGMAEALAKEAHCRVKVARQPVLTGALGAAILAARG